MRVVECSGWCTSPTRCSNHTRSYDLSLSVLLEPKVWRQMAISVSALGEGIAARGVVPSWVNGVSIKCQYLCRLRSLYLMFCHAWGPTGGRFPPSGPSFT